MYFNAEFRRDIQQNLLVLKDHELSNSLFQEKMLEHNQLDGLLPIRMQHMNGERMIFYDLHGVQPLSELCRVTLPNVAQLTSLVEGILQVLRKVGDYLLKEDDILLSWAYMFVRLPDYQVKLCYYPGYQSPIKKQISQLFEALMTCVDYEDREAVYLIYSLYMKSKDESCTVIDLEQLLYHRDTLEDLPARLKLSVVSETRDNDLEEKPVHILGTSQSLKQQQIQRYRHEQQKAQQHEQQKEQQHEQQKVQQREQQKARQWDQQKEQEKQPASNPSKDYYASQDIPLAMSSSVMPPELGLGHNVNTRMSTVKKEEGTKGNVFRPLISNHREEEKEVLFYPSNCYIFGGLVAISVVIVFGIILKSNILVDPVLKKVEPIKLIAALIIVILPAFYGIRVIFNPERKVSKFVSVRGYELKEIATTKETYEIPIIKTLSRPIADSNRKLAKAPTAELMDRGYDINERRGIYPRVDTYQAAESYQGVSSKQGACRDQRADTNERGDTNGRGDTNRRGDSSESSDTSHRMDSYKKGNLGIHRLNTWEEEIGSVGEEGIQEESKKSIGDNRTILLNGVQASPFAQLISEHPEKADTITLVECPFYIGTVKNQMNYSLSCPVISRYHAKIEKINGIYYIIDLNSTNGTFVNGRRLKAEEANVLIAGDKVAFANICFIFSCPNQKI